MEKTDGATILERLKRNHLTETWLMYQLRKMGYKVKTRAAVSNLLVKDNIGPKRQMMLERASKLLDRYERAMGVGDD